MSAVPTTPPLPSTPAAPNVVPPLEHAVFVERLRQKAGLIGNPEKKLQDQQ